MPLAGAQRELEEETGYRAKKWKPLVEYYASPGFLGESMKVFLAEGLIPGDAHPEEDEQIEFRLVKLSDVLKMIEKGAILDGKDADQRASLCTSTRKKQQEIRGPPEFTSAQFESTSSRQSRRDRDVLVSLCELLPCKFQSTFRALSSS